MFFVTTFSYSLTFLDVRQGQHVIEFDALINGKEAEDNVRFVNESNEGYFSAKIYGCRYNYEWEFIGTAELKGKGDKCFISTDLDFKYKRYAVTIDYAVDFDISLNVKKHDLCITINDVKILSPQNFSEPKPDFSESKFLVLDGKKYKQKEIDEMGGITSWYCTDWYSYKGNEVLLEVGYWNKYDNVGFVLFDGTNEGIEVFHSRQGLEHRWDWGEKKDGGCPYSFVITPDGTAKYFHFLEGETTAKPSSLYKAHRYR